MSIPFDDHLGVHPQDLHFLEREVWDLANTPLDKRPLLLHYHPLVIYRFQVLKQADVVLALFLQGELFTDEQKRADFEYYDPITTGDSTLSGRRAVDHRRRGRATTTSRCATSCGALFVDLADLHHNTADGVHVASTGGVWSALVYGFGGFRDHGGRFSLDPRLPESWPSLTFRLTLRGTPGPGDGALRRARAHHRGGRGGDARRARRVGHGHRRTRRPPSSSRARARVSTASRSRSRAAAAPTGASSGPSSREPEGFGRFSSLAKVPHRPVIGAPRLTDVLIVRYQLGSGESGEDVLVGDAKWTFGRPGADEPPTVAHRRQPHQPQRPRHPRQRSGPGRVPRPARRRARGSGSSRATAPPSGCPRPRPAT